MNRIQLSAAFSALLILGAPILPFPVRAQEAELRAPIDTAGTTPLKENPSDKSSIGGLSAPGADAMMTPDLLLVNPATGGTKPPEPLKAYIGVSLKLEINRHDIAFDQLRGLMITITNETNRPIIIDGDKATAMVGNKSIACIPVSVLQRAVIPAHDLEHLLDFIAFNIAPAAVTVGVVPTAKDIARDRRPVLERYGNDETRRRVEASRFGRRILWPHEKTQGIVYFQSHDSLADAHVEIPVTTLFDIKDTGELVSMP